MWGPVYPLVALQHLPPRFSGTGTDGIVVAGGWGSGSRGGGGRWGGGGIVLECVGIAWLGLLGGGFCLLHRWLYIGIRFVMANALEKRLASASFGHRRSRG